MKNNNAKHIIITGGTRGIGRAIAKELLAFGFLVHIVARDLTELQATQTELSQLGIITTSQVDLADRASIQKFTSVWDKPLYGLVNNAGMWSEEGLQDPDSGIWDAIMNLNLHGLYFLTKGLCPYLVHGGRIVNISSQLGTSGRARMGAYSASKHAVIGLTRSWALELGSRQITVNAVCPGWVKTQSNIDEIREDAKKEGKTFENAFAEIADSLILKRFIEPEEVAHLVGFLVSEKGSGITGQAYEIK